LKKKGVSTSLAVFAAVIILVGLTVFFAEGLSSTNTTTSTQSHVISTISFSSLTSSASTQTSSSVSSTSTMSESSSTSWSTTSSPAGVLPLGVNSTDGVILNVTLPTTVTLGQSIKINATIENTNATTISSLSGNVTITDAQGTVFFESNVVPFQAGSVKLAQGLHVSFTFLWNTSYAYAGNTPKAGTYTAKVIVNFVGLHDNRVESLVTFTVT
jgi:cytoskeletal protein RodZ